MITLQKPTSVDSEASRFLRDIPVELITTGESFRTPLPGWNDWQAPTPVISRDLPTTARPSLQIGDAVRHNSFGEGIVTGLDITASDTEVTIEFAAGVGQKRLLLGFAPLGKIG